MITVWISDHLITLQYGNIFDLFWLHITAYNEADWNSSNNVYKLPDSSEESKIRKANTTQAHTFMSDN